MAICADYLALHDLWAQARFGSFLVVPLKYDEQNQKYIDRIFTPMKLTTTDIGDNIKDMINRAGPGNIGQAYRIHRDMLEKELLGQRFEQLSVRKGAYEGSFSFMDSFLYIFHTKVAFLCLGLRYDDLNTIQCISNPGFASLFSKYYRKRSGQAPEAFSLEDALHDFAAKCGMRKFFDGESPVVVESYLYTLAMVPQRLPSIEVMRQATFNLHLMTDLNAPAEDEAEEDLRYVYAVKTQSLGSYRWGCCISSQTISYLVADASMKLEAEMEVQAQDGLPVVMLALYEKFTCLRFTELMSRNEKGTKKHLEALKTMMLTFQAYGTVTPPNLSRWHNVKQIYAALLEVNDTDGAIDDIGTKLSILAEQQQALQQQKSDTVSWIITIFGLVSIVDSMLSIVQTLSQGAPLDWITAGGTVAALAVVTVAILSLQKK